MYVLATFKIWYFGVFMHAPQWSEKGVDGDLGIMKLTSTSKLLQMKDIMYL